MGGGQYTNGHRPRPRSLLSLHRKLKMQNRRLIEVIKHERIERAALHEKIRLQEEAASRYTAEIGVLKAQLVAVKAALIETNTVLDDGINSFRLAKLRFHELHDGIDEDTTSNSKTMEQGSERFPNCHQAASSASSNANPLVLVPPPKLQARVNPMVQGVPLMSPSIMLQRLQPDDLERQMSSTPRAATATAPISPNLHEPI
uniref:Uncharacterized protein n=1 Tax=Lygus hesperus TaxID=30085 RepID=A0A0K8S576_LYGHE